MARSHREGGPGHTKRENLPRHAGTTKRRGICITVDTSAGNLYTRSEDVDKAADVTEASNTVVDVGRTNHDRLIHAGRGG